MTQRSLLSTWQRFVAAALVLIALPGHGAEPTRRTVRVGFISPYSPSAVPHGVTAFWDRLRELGWVEGQNLVIEARSADGRIDRLPALMAEVIGRKADVLVTSGTPAATAAKKATSTVPIVAIGMGDPIGTGLVVSLARPGGNLTGLSVQWGDLVGKWLELLQEAVPRLATVAVISNPESPIVRKAAKDLQGIAPRQALKLRFEDVREQGALAHAFKQARQEAQAALVIADPLTVTFRQQITALAAEHRLPTLYVGFEFMDTGGLMAYGVDNRVLYRRAADYVDKILRGARPADLPVEQPMQFSLAVNLKAARALGLTVPESILLRAGEIIR